MKRTAAFLALGVAIGLVFVLLFGRAMDYEYGEIERRGCVNAPVEGSPCDHDGRLHPCGWETADGVTEHLDAYAERCGR